MSKYFRTLSRLERGRASEIRGRVREPGHSATLAQVSSARVDPRVSSAMKSDVVTLLDTVRSTTLSTQAPRAVFASPESSDLVGPLVSELAHLARQRGLKVLFGQLDDADGRSLLQHSDDSGAIIHSEAVSAEELRATFRRAGDHHDLMLLQAPPLKNSLDAALLGKECAGLVLVVEPLVTTRRGLRKAVARVRSAGCPILGLVICGGKPWLPRWLRRFLSDEGSSDD